MCGILGIIKSKKSNLNKDINFKLLKDLFVYSESRGKEAAGFCFANQEYIYIGKTSMPASFLINQKEYKKTFNNFIKHTSEFHLAFGHARLVTHGYEQFFNNNQPVVFENMVLVHNGIVVNYNELWNDYLKGIKPKTDLDTEIIPALIHYFLNKSNNNYYLSIKHLFEVAEGVINIALFNSIDGTFILASNNGSIYYYDNESLIFASEKTILKKVLNKNNIAFDENDIKQIKNDNIYRKLLSSNINIAISDFINIDIDKKLKKQYFNTSLEHAKNFEIPEIFADHALKAKEKISQLKRCTKCLLPETFPYIEFDNLGVCNYCNSYVVRPILGKQKLIERTTNIKKCLVAFSGGRDSSYCLHYVKNILNIEPVAYSYDWGMLTDLGRRNQSRMCSKLGIEHILVSADIRKKRKNIRLNVDAWLNKPSLGTIPLFMAGDKQYFYHAYRIMKEYDLPLLIMGENYLEKTGFKTAFSGAKQTNKGFMAYHISTANKMRMTNYYLMQFLKNPAYLNPSLVDTIAAAFSYYGLKHDYINLFNYIPWIENDVNSVLTTNYNWETDPEIDTTWRIGDGTVAFYNYIYYTVAGFTEADTFRSNQIREGLITREDALKKLICENIPRWKSIKWYCNTIGIDFERTIKRINEIKSLY